MTTALAIAAAVLAALVGMLGMAWWRQERIVFQPPRIAVAEPSGVQRVSFAASDGTQLFAYVVEARSRGEARAVPPTGAMMIAFHGNADLAAWLIPWAREVAARTGWTLMLPEYRGYAGLPGTPTYSGSQLDARAAYAYARDILLADPAHIALFGHSLGSAIAAELARDVEVPPIALVLQSPFTSARDMARRIVLLPLTGLWRLITRVHFDTERIVATSDAQVSVAHGERDLIVPARMGRRVYAAARVKGPLLIVPHAGHNDVSDIAGEQYWTWIAAALAAERTLAQRAGGSSLRSE